MDICVELYTKIPYFLKKNEERKFGISDEMSPQPK